MLYIITQTLITDLQISYGDWRIKREKSEVFNDVVSVRFVMVTLMQNQVL